MAEATKGSSASGRPSSINRKFDGLIDEGLYKQFRRRISTLMNYVYAVSPAFEGLSNVITFIRLVQFLAPSLCVGYIGLWTDDGYAYTLTNAISIAWQLVPSSALTDSAWVVNLVFSALILITIGLLIGSSIYVEKKAMLPSYLPTILSFWQASFGFIVHPIVMHFAGSDIGRWLTGESYSNTTISLTMAFVAIVGSIVYIAIYCLILAPTLTFRSTSLLTFASFPACLLIISQNVLVFVIALAEYHDKVVRIVVLVIGAFIYGGSLFIVNIYGGIVSLRESTAFVACAGIGAVMSIAMLVTIALGNQAGLPYLIVLAIGFIAALLLVHFVLLRIQRTRLMLLDDIHDEPDLMADSIKKVNFYVNLTVEGFRCGHPVCIDWSLPKWALGVWPQHEMPWFLFAKFIAIFPEQSQNLAWAYSNVLTKHVKGSSARVVKSQSMSITRERETNLVPDLKYRLKQFSKMLASAKTKLRRLWDLAIQGNITDMDDAAKKALAAVEQCDASIRHIEREFPNNRFVTRQYCRFADEVLANRPLANELLEKSRLLLREIRVNKDHAHEWGIAAFCNLPERTAVEQTQRIQDAASAITDSTDAEPEQSAELDEDAGVIQNYITNLTFPAVRKAIIIQLLIFVILFCGWLIFDLVYSIMIESEMVEPIDFLMQQAQLRTQAYAVAGFGQQVVYEKIPEANWVRDEQTAPPPQSVGGSWLTGDQFLFFGHEMTRTLQLLINFRGYESTSTHVMRAQTLLFDSIHDFQYFDGTRATLEKVSIQVGLVNILSQQPTLLEPDTWTSAVLSSSAYLNVLENVPALSPAIEEAINEMIIFSQNANTEILDLFLIMTITSCIFAVIVFLGTLIYVIIDIRHNQEKVYMCLTSLPKSQVSAIAEDLRTRKTESDDSTTANKTSKQEDNIMKVFSAGGTTNGAGDMSTMIVAILIILIAFLVFDILAYVLLILQCNLVIASSPHITYLQCAWGLALFALTQMFAMMQLNTPLANPLDYKTRLIQRFDDAIDKFTTAYVNARFGNGTIDIQPYQGYLEGTTEARTKLDCPNPEKIPDGFSDSTKCFSPDMVYGMMEAVLRTRVRPFRESNETTLSNPGTFRAVWALMVFPIYDALVYPMFASIPTTIINSVEDLDKSYYPAWCILLPLGLFFQIVSLLAIRAIETHMRRVLSLLLHCPPSVILQTPRVMSVLSGDFSSGLRNDSTKNASFFRSVVLQIPDAIMTVQIENMNIISTNHAADRLFGEDIIGSGISDFLRNHFQGNIEQLLNAHPEEGGHKESLIYQKDPQTPVNLDVYEIPMGETIVYSFRDVTQTVRYNTLIAFERSKSDQMLKSILPPSLVGRVQAGEKNISFAVTSASVVFIDIVSFTPWCGSSQADKVMMTLNNMFKRFDANCNAYPTMTRIKCIGDCYMAAGGVFDEVNQPAEHAKEVVSFGLDCLTSIGEMNVELGERLQIRVGVNTGGPIVAGVLGGGVGKPTFEILGPAINMAQQMEHHGVPMAVHISRAVYELIYGDTFMVKERGSLEVKGQPVVTYLVSGKTRAGHAGKEGQ